MAATNSIIKLLIICLTIITITVILTYKSSILITHTSKDNKMRYLSIRNVTSGRDEKNDTTEKLEDPVPTEKFHEDVKPHVAKAISKMYHELKANGTIINDLISTKEPIIPNIYHFIR
ncbi:hypothetical protein EB796_022683 [Bugula neritina]|uniref:Uncharacterized protein n=1 Tax=Bugula neritina TaxID=10212 RepID=A0A7J7IZL0_BUGNE|nr:hypothetical protein EB796_022683 [Bugula neritina]